MKNKNHDDIVKNYDGIKAKHLENLASKMLKKDEEATKLKSKHIDPGFLNLF
jgi:hypothetical protein